MSLCAHVRGLCLSYLDESWRLYVKGEWDTIVTPGKFAARNGLLDLLATINWPSKELRNASSLRVVRFLFNVRGVVAQRIMRVASMDILIYLRKRGCYWDGELYDNLVAEGRLEELQYAWRHGTPPRFAVRVTATAASTGDVALLDAVHDMGFPLNGYTASMAARYGHLNIIRSLPEACCRSKDKILTPALEEGHVDCVAYGLDNGLAINQHLVWDIIKYGNVDVLKLAMSKGLQLSSQVCKHVVAAGSVDMLIYVMSLGYELDRKVASCDAAARGGHMDMLAHLRSLGCEWNAGTSAIAAECGRVDMLRYLFENGCEWDDRTCTGAARRGHLDVLMFAREHDCPLSAVTMTRAFEQGDAAVVSFLLDSGGPWHPSLHTDALENSHVQCALLALLRKLPGDAQACAKAASMGNACVLKLLRAAGSPWDMRTLHGAVDANSLACLVYAHTTGCPLDASVMEAIIEQERDDMFLYGLHHSFPVEDTPFFRRMYARLRHRKRK